MAFYSRCKVSLVFVMLLGTLLIFHLPASQGDDEEQIYDINLYMRSGGVLSTEAPSGTVPLSTDNITFALKSALTTTLTVKNSIKIEYWGRASSPRGNATFKFILYEDEKVVANATDTLEGISQSSHTVDLGASNYTFHAGTYIRLSVKVSGGLLWYDAASFGSHLILNCQPIQDISLYTYNSLDEATTHFYPNSWPSREVRIKGSMIDAFGPEDIARVMINITKDGEQIASGAANVTNYTFSFTWNYSDVSPEEGMYDCSAAVEDMQGNTYTASTFFFFLKTGVLLSSPFQATPGVGTARTTAPYNGTVEYEIHVRNVGSEASTINLTKSGRDAEFGELSNENVYVNAGDVSVVYLNVSTVGAEVNATLFINITATVDSESSTLETQTRVSPYGIEMHLKGEDNRSILLGDSEVYEVEVKNSGGLNESVVLNVADLPSGWNAWLDQTSIESLPPGSTVTVKLTVVAPTEISGQSETVSFTLHGRITEENITSRLRLRATAIAPIWLEALDELSISIEPEKTAKVSFSLRNNMDEMVNIDLSWSGGSGFHGTVSFSPSSPLLMSAKSSKVFSFQATPERRTLAAEYTFTITATSRENHSISVSSQVKITVNAYHEITLGAEPTSFSVRPGESKTLSLKVENKGNVQERVTLSVTITGPEGKHNWANMSKDTVVVEAQSNRSVSVSINVPEDAKLGEYTININATTPSDSAVAPAITMLVYQVLSVKIKTALKELYIPLILLLILIVITFVIRRRKQKA